MGAAVIRQLGSTHKRELQRFAHRASVPPGGQYFYQHPDDDVVVSDFTMRGCVRKAVQRLRGAAIEVPGDLEALIEDYMCKHLPQGFCTGPRPMDQQPVVTMIQVRQLTQERTRGRRRVTPGEVRERIDICLRCPMNDLRICPTCSGMTGWALQLVGRDRAAQDAYLGVCRVDHVLLPAKVTLANNPILGQPPDNCWVTR